MNRYQVLPDLSSEDFAALRADIAARGVLVPVEYDENGNILDGHHRVRACEELGLADWPRFIRTGLSEADKRVHARQLNLARRHLSRDQKRDLIAAQLRETPAKSNRQVAERLGVSHPTVANVRREMEATGDVVKVTTTTDTLGRSQPARKPIRTTFVDPDAEAAEPGLAERALRAMIKRGEEPTRAELQREVLAAAKAIRAEKQAETRAARTEKLVALSQHNAPLPDDRTYPVIYADPPWEYDFSPSSGRAVENHYPTMPIEDILAMGVARLATPDAMLFLWCPPSFIKKGLAVLEAWGFDLASSMVWDKEKIGTGIYFRQQHEYLLLGKRGKPITPAPGTQPRSVLRSPRTAHSAKPVEVYDLIEAMYPGLPKIELFSRSPQPGWASWGNQAHVREHVPVSRFRLAAPMMAAAE
jgi:N6-adenosine-specific RNA methylase IME4